MTTYDPPPIPYWLVESFSSLRFSFYFTPCTPHPSALSISFLVLVSPSVCLWCSCGMVPPPPTLASVPAWALSSGLVLGLACRLACISLCHPHPSRVVAMFPFAQNHCVCFGFLVLCTHTRAHVGDVCPLFLTSYPVCVCVLPFVFVAITLTL